MPRSIKRTDVNRSTNEKKRRKQKNTMFCARYKYTRFSVKSRYYESGLFLTSLNETILCWRLSQFRFHFKIETRNKNCLSFQSHRLIVMLKNKKKEKRKRFLVLFGSGEIESEKALNLRSNFNFIELNRSISCNLIK